MKHQSSKHTSHGKEHHDFISLISLSLLAMGLLILLYLLAFCHPPDRGCAPLIRFASAREQEAEGNEISQAVFLSENKNLQISLAPYGQRYFYIVFQKNCYLQILSGSSSIKVTCYSQKGRKLSIPRENDQYQFWKISGTSLASGDRIFLKFANMSTKLSAIKVRYGKNPAKKTAKKHVITPKPKKTASDRKKASAQKETRMASKNIQTTSKPRQTTKGTAQATSMPRQTKNDTAQTTSTPRQATRGTVKSTPKPTQRAKERTQPSSVSVKPHFLRLAINSRKELSLALGKSSLDLADCTYFLTDTSLLTIQGNTLTAKKAGTAILYVRSKKSAICGSCLIRVTEK